MSCQCLLAAKPVMPKKASLTSVSLKPWPQNSTPTVLIAKAPLRRSSLRRRASSARRRWVRSSIEPIIRIARPCLSRMTKPRSKT